MAGNLRSAYTAVIARGQWWDGPWESEPYEAAWAAEAIFFVRVLKVRGGAAAGASVEARVQLSPDGMHWVDEGSVLVVPALEGALRFARVADFGGWLRLAVEPPSPGLGLQVVATLALKG